MIGLILATVIRPSPTPIATPITPTMNPCNRNTPRIWLNVAPSAFNTPISRVFCTVTVINVLMIPNAATTMMKMRMKNITDFSTWIAASSCRFRSAQVFARRLGRSPASWPFNAAATSRAPATGSSVISSTPWTAPCSSYKSCATSSEVNIRLTSNSNMPDSKIPLTSSSYGR